MHKMVGIVVNGVDVENVVVVNNQGIPHAKSTQSCSNECYGGVCIIKIKNI